MRELWTRWIPVQNLADKYKIVSFSNDFECLMIELSDVKNAANGLRLIFDGSAEAYRFNETNFRVATINELEGCYGQGFCAGWTFFSVAQSSYRWWLGNEAYGKAYADAPDLFKHLAFNHLAIISANIFFDVLYWSEPKIEFFAK